MSPVTTLTEFWSRTKTVVAGRAKDHSVEVVLRVNRQTDYRVLDALGFVPGPLPSLQQRLAQRIFTPRLQVRGRILGLVADPRIVIERVRIDVLLRPVVYERFPELGVHREPEVVGRN